MTEQRIDSQSTFRPLVERANHTHAGAVASTQVEEKKVLKRQGALRDQVERSAKKTAGKKPQLLESLVTNPLKNLKPAGDQEPFAPISKGGINRKQVFTLFDVVKGLQSIFQAQSANANAIMNQMTSVGNQIEQSIQSIEGYQNKITELNNQIQKYQPPSWLGWVKKIGFGLMAVAGSLMTCGAAAGLIGAALTIAFTVMDSVKVKKDGKEMTVSDAVFTSVGKKGWEQGLFKATVIAALVVVTVVADQAAAESTIQEAVEAATKEIEENSASGAAKATEEGAGVVGTVAQEGEQVGEESALDELNEDEDLVALDQESTASQARQAVEDSRAAGTETDPSGKIDEDDPGSVKSLRDSLAKRRKVSALSTFSTAASNMSSTVTRSDGSTVEAGFFGDFVADWCKSDMVVGGVDMAAQLVTSLAFSYAAMKAGDEATGALLSKQMAGKILERGIAFLQPALQVPVASMQVVRGVALHSLYNSLAPLNEKLTEGQGVIATAEQQQELLNNMLQTPINLTKVTQSSISAVLQDFSSALQQRA